ncbi:MAG: hypothetical protein IJW59_04220 [Clostridia bacterium]|nr:hypothetical protein [Clostridia bacterium]
MIKYKMPDAGFDLRTVSDEELFNVLKEPIAEVIKTFKGYENTTSEFVKLNTKYTTRRDAFGRDKDLYHNIILSIGVKSHLTYDSFNLFINPFEIKIALDKYDPQIVENENLTNSFLNFMINKFPQSNYIDKRKEYFKKAKTFQQIEEDLLFY